MAEITVEGISEDVCACLEAPFVQRIPKSLHQRLAARAAAESVRLNQLAATCLAHGLAEGSGVEPQRSDGQ